MQALKEGTLKIEGAESLIIVGFGYCQYCLILRITYLRDY